ncbi:MAG: HAD-IA family hydrolase [Candidatus Eremiobacteraeota bacterium]|nr:HAD-IA family hydrolase [Candidatus Eremiobacteraeota bacterium]
MVNTLYDAVFFDLFGTLVDDRALAIPGARECVATLEGSRWAIVTSCGTDFARRLIKHAGLPEPPLLVSCDDVLHNKPAPDSYLFAAKKYDVVPERALVVEDSLQGVAAACEAGMDVVAILRGRSPQFARAATFVIKDLASLRLHASDGAIELEV